MEMIEGNLLAGYALENEVLPPHRKPSPYLSDDFSLTLPAEDPSFYDSDSEAGSHESQTFLPQ